MSKEEKEMIEAFRKLSVAGRVDVLSHTNTILKAENGIKKQYGLDSKKAVPARKRKSA